ncbi:hypothetical protein [Halomontanus rarus]|uniref:hypothetical protein n=1 Tax=Halomontanus rarus TaxID=3034020 RepID=UPI0023E84F86|nr:hypothetical protein [Halovivax sp. TS33]
MVAEQFLTRVPGCLDDDVIDRDEAVVGVESIDPIVDRIDKGAIMLEGLGVVRISPERHFRRPGPFTHIHLETPSSEKSLAALWIIRQLEIEQYYIDGLVIMLP